MSDNTKSSETPSSQRGGRRGLWLRFTEETSLHACKNLTNREKSLPERIWWGLLFWGMIFGLIFTLAQVLVSYRKYRLRDHLWNISQLWNTLPSPSAMPFEKTKVNNFDQFNDFLVSTNWILMGLIPRRNMSLDFPWINQRHDQFYHMMSLRKQQQVVSAMLDGVLDIDMSDEVYGVTGMCFRFNSKELIERHAPPQATSVGLGGALQLVLNIHQDKYFAGPYSQAGMQSSNIQTVTHRPIRLRRSWNDYFHRLIQNTVQVPYKSFGSDTCVESDHPGFRNPLKYSSTYSLGACLQECHTDLSTSACHCKTAMDPDELPLPHCTILQVSMCTLPLYAKVYLNQTSQREVCDCKRPCTFYEYDTKISHGVFPSMAAADYMVKYNFVNSTDYARQNLVNIYLYYEQLIMNKIEHEPEYTPTTVTGTLGGQLGFFLGASVITIYEVMELILHTTKTFIGRRTCSKGARVMRKKKNSQDSLLE